MSYSKDELVEAILKERKRAIKIVNEMQDKFAASGKEKRQRGSGLAFVDERVANELRIAGNSISGLNALSHTLKTTMKDLIINDLEKS